METFVFRPLTLADIATTIGKPSTELTLSTEEDGIITIDTPNLSPPERAKLKAMFAARGLIESTR